MIVESNILKTPSSYAKDKKITRDWVYKLIKENKIKHVKIDGVLFVVVEGL